MSYGRSLTPTLAPRLTLTDSAKARLNDALNLRIPTSQIPPQSQTVSEISALNADIAAFMEELGQLIDSIDPSKVSVPTWFWNGKHPITGVAVNFMVHDCKMVRNRKKVEAGEPDYVQDCKKGAGSAIKNRGAIQQLAKMLRVVNRESMVLEQVSRILVGMLGLHVDDDPAFIKEQLDKYRTYIQIPRQSGWCVRPYLHEFVRGSNSKQVQGTNGTETCYDAVTGARAAEKAKLWAQKQIDSLGEKNAEEVIANEMFVLRDQIQSEINTIENLLEDIRSAYASLPTLYLTEKEEGVTPDFKRALTETWHIEIDNQGGEIETNLEDVGGNTNGNNGSLLGPVLLGLGLAGLTFYFAKKRGV